MTFLRLCSRAPWMTRRSVPIGRASVEASADTPGRRRPILQRWNGTCERHRCSKTSRPSSARCWSRGSALPSRPAIRRPRPTAQPIAFRGQRLDRLEGHPLGRICMVSSRRHGSPPGHPRSERRLGAAVVARRPTIELPVGSRLEGTAPALRAGHGGCPQRLVQLTTLPGTVEWHRWSPDGTRMLAGLAGTSAEQADALGSGTLGGEPDVPAWVPGVESSTTPRASDARCGWSMWARARHAGSPARTATSGKPTGAARIGLVAVTSDGAGEDAWYGAGVGVIDLATGDERPLATSRRAVRMGRRLALRRAGGRDRGRLQRSASSSAATCG